MGGIVVFLPSGGPAQPPVARAMLAAAPHRGSRHDVVVHGRCILGAANGDDRSDAVVGVAGGLAVAFNGTLDNPADLARDLVTRGALPAPADATPAPTLAELLAAGFRTWGEDLPARMRGIFAGAITDGETVFAFRDHIGYRSLFYRRDAGGFHAASEAKQVVAGAGIPHEPDLDVVEHVYYRSATDDTPCALRGVLRLPKSTGIRAAGDGVRLRRYWHPESLLETAGYPADELKARFDALMDQAVSRSLTGPDAISLSGGIDSPAIAAYAAPRHLERFGSPLEAVTVIFPKYPSVDESRYVVPLAQALGIPLHAYEQERNALADLARWTALVDTPFAGATLTQYEEDYRRIRAFGFRTLLTGEHAEFVFAIRWFTLGHLLTRGRFGPARRELAQRRANGMSWIGLARLAARSVAPDRVMDIRHAIGRRWPVTVPRWVDPRRAAEEEAVPVRERWNRSQLAGFIGPGIALEAEEICQEVCDIRVRRPWTDVDLWELFLGLPAEQKFPDLRPKGLVRDLLRGRVPDAILDRTDKTVFDEAGLARIDYPTLRRYLVGQEHRVKGIDYEALAELLRTETLSRIDLEWAKNLANAHAFLAQWGGSREP